mgnify:CR=1 FL=1
MSILASRCGGFVAADHASEVKVDGDEALHLAYLYYSLRSDEKSRSWQLGLAGSWNLSTLLLATWTLGASEEHLEEALGLQNCF